MINVYDYVNVSGKVRIVFTDDAFIDGYIESVDDEDESELGEPGITVNAVDGAYVGIAQSEIKTINILDR